MKYIVVFDYEGIPYFLLMGKVINWYFSSPVRIFKTEKTAKKHAIQSLARLSLHAKGVHVILVNDIDYISCSSISKFYNTDREIFTITKEELCKNIIL